MTIRLLAPRKTALLLFILILVMLVVSYVVVYLPKAVITIYAAKNGRTVEQDITISSSENDPDFLHFTLPTQTVSADVEEEKIFTRDEENKFDDFSKGEIILVNQQNEVQELLPKTHLKHEEKGIFFLTDNPVAIPANGKTRVTVTAKEKGISGDVNSGKFIIDKLATSLQDKIYGYSESQMSGGEAINNPISDSEFNSAKEELKQEVIEKMKAKLTTQAGGAEIKKEFITVTAEEFKASVPIGSKAIEYTMKIKLTGQAFIIDETDLLGLTLLKLRSAAGPEEEFINYDPKSFSIQLIKSDFNRGEAIVKGSLNGNFAKKLGIGLFNSSNLAGLSSIEVKERLQQVPGVGDVKVNISPFWVKSVPSRPGATQIIIKNDKDQI